MEIPAPGLAGAYVNPVESVGAITIVFVTVAEFAFASVTVMLTE